MADCLPHVDVVAGLLLGRFGGSKTATSSKAGNGSPPRAARPLSPPDPAPMEMELTEFAPPSSNPPDNAHLVSGSSSRLPSLDGAPISHATPALALQEKADSLEGGHTSSVSSAGARLLEVGFLEGTSTTSVSATVLSPIPPLDPAGGEGAGPSSMPAAAAHQAHEAGMRVREDAPQEGGVPGGRMVPGGPQQGSSSVMAQLREGSGAGAAPLRDHASSEVPASGRRAPTTQPVTATEVSTVTTLASAQLTVRFADESSSGTHSPDQQPSGSKLFQNGMSQGLPETERSAPSLAESGADDGEYFRLLEGIRRTRSETQATRLATSTQVSHTPDRPAEEVSSGGVTSFSLPAFGGEADLAHFSSSPTSSCNPAGVSAAGSAGQVREGLWEGSPASAAPEIPGDLTQGSARVPGGLGKVGVASSTTSPEGPGRAMSSLSHPAETTSAPAQVVPAQRREQVKGSALTEPAGVPSLNRGGAQADTDAGRTVLLGPGSAAAKGQSSAPREAGLAPVGSGGPRSNVAKVAQLSRISSDVEGTSPLQIHVYKPHVYVLHETPLFLYACLSSFSPPWFSRQCDVRYIVVLVCSAP